MDMPSLQDLPVEILDEIPLWGREVKDLVRTCRMMYQTFNPRLYRVVQYQSRVEWQQPSRIDQAVVGHGWTELQPILLGASALTSPHAVHRWLHTLGAEPRLRDLTRRLYLRSDLSLKDNGPRPDLLAARAGETSTPTDARRVCDVSLCRCYDWTFLGALPNLEHVTLSTYWRQFFVFRRPALPFLRSVRTTVARPCQELCLLDPDLFRSAWEVADLCRLAGQPDVVEVEVFDGQILHHDDELDDPGNGFPKLRRLRLDRVDVRGAALAELLCRSPALEDFHWRRTLEHCPPWQGCRCDDAVTRKLDTALRHVRGSLRTLSLSLCSHERQEWSSPRCLRNCSVLPTLEPFHRLTKVRIAVELLLGRRVCRLRGRVEQCPPETLATKLPSGLRHVTLFVHVLYAMYEENFRQRLAEGILRDRNRLSSLCQVVIEDQLGDIFDEDFCGNCAIHDPFTEPMDLRELRVRCAEVGLSFKYQPSSASALCLGSRRASLVGS